MGYSARFARFRYTQWVPYNITIMQANLNETVVEELYDYANDPKGNINLAKRPKFESLIAKFRKVIKRKIQMN